MEHNQLVKSMVEYLTAENQRYLDYEAQIILDAMNANDGHAPTKDKKGRLHAPFNGYLWKDMVYGAGEYLSDDSLRQACTNRCKIKMPAEQATQINEQVNALNMFYVRTGMGKVWNDYKTKQDTCYLYVHGITQSTASELHQRSIERLKKEQEEYQKEQEKRSNEQLERFSYFDNGEPRPEIKEGRQFITGVIEHIKHSQSEGMFYVHYNQKMRILTEEGTFITGTVPDQFYEQLVVGDRVTVKGTVKQSSNNKSFGFYSRPSNFELLACSLERSNTLDLQRIYSVI